MYIMDGIAFAGEPEKPIKVTCVRPLDGYRLHLRFNNGACGIFDMTALLSSPDFIPLQDKSLFDRVYVDFGSITWQDGEIDIAPEFVFEHTDFSDSELGA